MIAYQDTLALKRKMTIKHMIHRQFEQTTKNLKLIIPVLICKEGDIWSVGITTIYHVPYLHIHVSVFQHMGFLKRLHDFDEIFLCSTQLHIKKKKKKSSSVYD